MIEMLERKIVSDNIHPEQPIASLQVKKTNFGLIYMFFGSLSMSLMNVCAKFLKNYTTITVLEVCYFRSFIMSIGCAFHAYCAGFSIIEVPSAEIGKWVFLRSFCGFFAFSF